MEKIWGGKNKGFILLFPTLFVFFLIEIYPFLYGVYLALSKGGHYFGYVVSDPNLILSFKISLLYSILSVTFTFLLGFLFAVTFERGLTLKPIYELLFFIPWAIPKYIFILSFRAILHGYNGNSLFNSLFGTHFNLVDSTFYSWAAILIVSVILSLPFTTLIIRNALGTTERELKYVSHIDGATPLEYYINIALPQIYPVLVPFITLEFIKAFKVFNVVYLLTQGGPPILEGFGEKSIVGATTTLTLLSYSMFSEGDDPVIGISYSIVIGLMVLFFLFLLFLSFHITKRYKKYKGLFVIMPFLFHSLGLFPGIGLGSWEFPLILLYLPSLYYYIKRNSIFRRIFAYEFFADIMLNILFMWTKASPFSFSIGTIFTFFMFLFIRPNITIWGGSKVKYGEFYKRTFYWFSIVIVSSLLILQEKFIKGAISYLLPLLIKIENSLKYVAIGILLLSLFLSEGIATRLIILILLVFIFLLNKKTCKRENHPLFHLFLAIYLFVLMLPLYSIIWMSLSEKNTLLIASFLPHPITLSNFSKIISKENFLLFTKNSLFVSILTFILVILFSFGFSLYLARKKGLLGDFLKNIMIYISSFTGIYTLLPLYIVFRSLHLLNNLWALSLIFTVNTLPVAILSTSGAISNLSPSFEEAASLDGARAWQILLYIILPLIRPSIFMSGILGFMGAWGGFFAPLIFLNEMEKYTIPIKLFSYVGEIGSQYPSWTLFSAGAVLSSIPIFLLFFLTKVPRKNNYL